MKNLIAAFVLICFVFISCKKENLSINNTIHDPYNYAVLKASNYDAEAPNHYLVEDNKKDFVLQDFLQDRGIISIDNKILLQAADYTFLSNHTQLNVLEELYFPATATQEKQLAKHYRINPSTASGRIEVYDPISQHYQPLKNVHIYVVDGHRSFNTYTDEDGNFSISKYFYTNHIDVYVQYSNSVLDIRVLDADHLEQAFFPLLVKINSFSQNSLQNIVATYGGNMATDTSKQHVYAATSWCNYYLYSQFAMAQGYSLPHSKKMSLWIAKDALLSASYAAPMLNQLSNTQYPKRLLTELFHLPSSLSGMIAQLLKHSLPDIYAPYYSHRYPGEGYMLSLFHEFSHAVHYVKAGNAFWYNYISYIYSNTGYGNGNSPERGRVALSEAWAEDLSMQCARYHYGGDLYSDALLDSNTSTASWIPWGVYYDLADANTNVESWDKVQHFTFPQMYNMLSPEMDDISKLKIQLKATYDQMPYIDPYIDSLFAHYGW